MLKLLEYIEQSKEWICPKSGIWKIIAVGGGGAGCTSISKPSTAGGSTSFGEYLTVSGGESVSISDEFAYRVISTSSSDSSMVITSGIDGFDGFSNTYRSVSKYAYEFGNRSASSSDETVHSLKGSGYGAGGGTYCSISSNSTGYGISGRPGKVCSTILQISEGEVIPCTIGKAGSTYATDGVIIVQYVGELV